MRPVGFRDLADRSARIDDLVWTGGLTAARARDLAGPAVTARDGLEAGAFARRALGSPAALIGPTPPPAVPAGLHTIFPGGVDTMPAYTQTGNGCGTTSLAMILTYTTGRTYTQADVDREIRRLDVFTSPGDVVAYSRKQGLNAEGYNHGSPEELRRFLDRGIPLQVVINAKGDSSNIGALHYIAVVGYETNAKGEITGFKVHDPSDGTTDVWKMDRFMSEWDAAKPGFDRFFIAHAPGGIDLPPGRWDGMREVLAVGESVTNALNNLDRVFRPKSVGDFVHGVVGMHGTLSWGVPTAIAGFAKEGTDWLNNQVDKVPVLKQIAGPPLSFLAGGFGALAALGTAAGNAWDHGSSAVGNLVDGNWKQAWEDTKATGRAVVDGVVGAAKEVGNGIVNGIKKLKFW